MADQPASKTRRTSTLRTDGPTTKGNEIVDRIASFRPPTDAERSAIDAAIARADARPARVSIKSEAKAGGVVAMWPPHSDGHGFCEQLRDTFGSSSDAFCSASATRLDPLLRNPGDKCAPDGRVNAALAVMGAIAPANELEAIIGEQIIGTHTLSIDLMGRAQHADTIPKQEAYINMATKLSRTMAAQVEALSRLRSGGKQQVIVKHVYINGNAVVGDNAQTVLQAGGRGVTPEISANPMQRVFSMHLAPRCGAKTRSGSPCLSPVVRGRKRCRMHGGTNPGAPTGEANGQYRTGKHTQELLRSRSMVRALVRLARSTLNDV